MMGSCEITDGGNTLVINRDSRRELIIRVLSNGDLAVRTKHSQHNVCTRSLADGEVVISAEPER